MADNTKYIFNNKQYNKRRLVLALVKQYVSDFKPSLSELKEQFPTELQGSLDVIISSEERAEKSLISNDINNRYFFGESELLLTSDGGTAYVSNQWGNENIDRLINSVKDLDYDVIKVMKKRMTIKELFEEYKNAPSQEWINDYKVRCSEVQLYINKESSELDEEFLKGIWKDSSNGIANASPGIMSNDEFYKLRDDLPVITSKIMHNPSPQILDEVITWAKEARDNGKFKSIKWGVINRVFSAVKPSDYSTIINKTFVEKLIGKLNSLYELDISTNGNWAELNISLMNAIKSQGLQNEDVFLVNTFAWKLYVLLVENEKNIQEGVDGDQSASPDYQATCKNVIYYGPPGTGKTYKLQKLLMQKYTDNEITPDSNVWLSENLEDLSWYEIIILILLDSGSYKKVADITSHEYYRIKAKLNDRSGNLRATAWSALQSHTVQGSATVNSSARREPLIFNKTEDSLWYLVDEYIDQLEEYKVLCDQLKAGPQLADTIKRYEFVTFHQSYGYEEFVEGLRPVSNSDGDISYEVKPGVFKRLCKRAESDPDNQYAIVIDEINRGNISKIFGELITLIETDKREGASNVVTVTLPYSSSTFSVPSNIDIIGTMNTADRSLTHIDVALRRRFDFKELRTDYSLVSDDMDGINLRWMLYAINQRIELLLDREHILGHALIMNVSSINELEHTFTTNIMPLLEEYFFENWDKINRVLNNNGFVDEQIDAHGVWLGEDDDYAAKTYRINLNELSNTEAYKEIYSGISSAKFAECELMPV